MVTMLFRGLSGENSDMSILISIIFTISNANRSAAEVHLATLVVSS